jgi:hypothetical protein
MGMVCDACGDKYKQHESGHATVHVSPPRPDFKALIAAGLPCETREPLALDLCAACTTKTLAALGLSTEIMELPEVPKAGDEETDRPNASALTQEELRTLGLLEPGTSPKI